MRNHKESRWSTATLKYGGQRPSSGNPSPSVPPWEIHFCSQIPWAKFCEDKRLTFLFENVLNWDDSSGKEAFDNAKSRFWAEINNLHCDIPLPDPDMYIDTVNHDTFLDPKLVEDLHKPPPLPPREEVPDYNSIKIIPTGWDVEYPVKEGNTIPLYISAGDDESTPRGNVGTVSSTQQSRCTFAETPIPKSDAVLEPFTIVPTGWGDEEEEFNSSSNACDLPAKGTDCTLCAKDGNFVKSSHRSSSKEGIWGNGRDFGPRFSSKHNYRMNDYWRGCSGWHAKGLSCAPGNYQR